MSKKKVPIDNVASELKDLIKERREVGKKVKEFRQSLNEDGIKEAIREKMDILYEYMIEHDIDQIDTYSLEFCKPKELKSEERKEKKREDAKTTLKTVPLKDEQISKVLSKLKI